jgi:hypothetical protein
MDKYFNYLQGVIMLYDITIAGIGGTAPSDGFIDPKTVYAYMEANKTDLPTSYANALAKSRANVRNRDVMASIQTYSQMEIKSVTATGSPSASTPPSSIIIRVSVNDVADVVTRDENNAGALLTGDAAVKRIIARALVKSMIGVMDIFDPTKTTAPGNATPAIRTGTRFNTETTGALYANLATAGSSVTITAV